MGEPVIFDAADIAATLRPPVFRFPGGREVTGGFLSIEEWYACMVQHRALLDSAAPASAWVMHLRLFFDLLFPRAWWERWGAKMLGRLWRRWRPSVADIVLSWPYQRQLKAYNDFLASLAREQWPVLMTRTEQERTSEPGPTRTTEAERAESTLRSPG